MGTIHHRIRASLYDNALTKENPNDYIARVSSERSLNVKQICESAAARGGSDISAPAMEHGTNLFLREMAYQLCDGYSINTGYFTASTHIRGVFDSPNEHFDPSKHTLLFEFQQGAELRKELQYVDVEILGLADVGAVILQVTDAKTSSVNDLLSPAFNLVITGHKIRIAGDDPAVGIRFISQDDPDSVYPVPANNIVVNNPSELIILIPALIADTYKLEITTQFSGNKILLKKTNRTIFDKVLTVENVTV